ncbi:hypothetical protein L1987_15985 [Smallanthus sonchifolius]|uniref:Uncharacterized protein n=1 Tax=Smallanthus sonchifolius TaxID=185202 RepID=A0ACB9J7G2_9ASTR|nr:hypothetical protein L1987_15985 [Smallanthus sonchifolius]
MEVAVLGGQIRYRCHPICKVTAPSWPFGVPKLPSEAEHHRRLVITASYGPDLLRSSENDYHHWSRTDEYRRKKVVHSLDFLSSPSASPAPPRGLPVELLWSPEVRLSEERLPPASLSLPRLMVAVGGRATVVIARVRVGVR